MGYKTISIDDLGAKAGVLKIAGESIPTPIRVLTSKEVEQGDLLRAKHTVNEISYPAKIVQFTKNFNADILGSFATNSEVSYSVQKEIEDYSVRFPDAQVIFHPSIPTEMKIRKDKKVVGSKPIMVGQVLNKKLMEAQIQSGLEIITVQERHPSASAKELEERIKSSIKYLDDSDAEQGQIMVVLKTSMKEQDFKDKLEVIANHDCKFLDIVSGSVQRYFPNLAYIPKFARKHEDIFVYGSQIQRLWLGNKTTSMMHLEQPFSFDSYAVKLMPPIPINTPIKLVRANAKRFDGRTLGHLKADDHEKLHGNGLGDNCPVCDGRDLDGFFNIFSGVQQLRSALNTHEFFDSFREFQNSRHFVVQQDYRDYAKTKKFLFDPFKKLFGVDLKSKSLNWFRK